MNSDHKNINYPLQLFCTFIRWLLLFSHSVMSDSLWPHGLEYTRLPCPSPSHELAQTHVRWITDAIQQPRPLSSLSPVLSLSQHQGIYKWVNSLCEVDKVLEFQLQHQSFQWTHRTDLLWDGLVGSPCNPRDSQESSPTPQFKSINFWCSAFFTVQLSHSYMPTGKTIALTRWTFVGKVMFLLFNMLSTLVMGFLPRGQVSFKFHGCSHHLQWFWNPPK